MATPAADATAGSGPDPAVKAMLEAQEALIKATPEERPGLIDQYMTIIATATTNAQTKAMGTRMLPKFFAGFDEGTQTKALNAFLDLVEDEDSTTHLSAISKLPEFAEAVPTNVARLADVLAQLLEDSTREEQNAVLSGLTKLARVDAATVTVRLLEALARGNAAGAEGAESTSSSRTEERILLRALESRSLARFQRGSGIRGEPAVATARAVLAAACGFIDAGRKRVAGPLLRGVAAFSAFKPARPAAASAADGEAAAEPEAEPASLNDLVAETTGAPAVDPADAPAVARVLFFADSLSSAALPCLGDAVAAMTAPAAVDALPAASADRALALLAQTCRTATPEAGRALLPAVVAAVEHVCRVGKPAADGDVRFSAVEPALVAFHHLARALPRDAVMATGIDFDAASRKRIGFTGQPTDLAADAATDPERSAPLLAALRSLHEHAASVQASLRPIQTALRSDAELHRHWADAAKALVTARRKVEHAKAAAAARKVRAAAEAEATAAATAGLPDDASDEDKAAAVAAAVAALGPADMPKSADAPVPEPLTAEAEAAAAAAKDFSDRLERTRVARDTCASVARLTETLIRDEPGTVPPAFEPSYDRKPRSASSSSSSSSSGQGGQQRNKRGRSDSTSGGKGGGKGGASASASSSSGGRGGGGGRNGGGKGKGEPGAKRVNVAKPSGKGKGGGGGGRGAADGGRRRQGGRR